MRHRIPSLGLRDGKPCALSWCQFNTLAIDQNRAAATASPVLRILPIRVHPLRISIRQNTRVVYAAATIR
jgi:hypothetical protein